MLRFSEDAVARVLSLARSQRINQAIGEIHRQIEFTPFQPPPTELDAEAALLACELAVALARRPAPALTPYPELLAAVDHHLETFGAFGGPQLGNPHATARLLRDRAYQLRDRVVRESRTSDWEADIEDLIARLNPTVSSQPRPWWQQIDDITLTIMRGATPSEVESRLGLSRSSAKQMLFWNVWDGVAYDGIHLAVQIDELDDHTVICEPTGWVLTNERIATNVSVGGLLVSAYWNTNSLMQFTVAQDGRLVRRFDPLLYQQPGAGDPLPDEQDLPFGEPGSCRTAAVTLLERLSGVSIETAWLLERPHFTWHGIRAD
jgi:hypothetical protein